MSPVALGRDYLGERVQRNFAGAHGKTAAARRVLPMTPRVSGVLAVRWMAAGKPPEGWVWPAPSKTGHIDHSSLKKQHIKALKLSGVRCFVLYSLRHTFLTRLEESGVTRGHWHVLLATAL